MIPLCVRRELSAYSGGIRGPILPLSPKLRERDTNRGLNPVHTAFLFELVL